MMSPGHVIMGGQNLGGSKTSMLVWIWNVQCPSVESLITILWHDWERAEPLRGGGEGASFKEVRSLGICSYRVLSPFCFLCFLNMNFTTWSYHDVLFCKPEGNGPTHHGLRPLKLRPNRHLILSNCLSEAFHHDDRKLTNTISFWDRAPLTFIFRLLF